MRQIRYGMVGFGGIAEHRLAKEGFCLDRHRFAPAGEAILVAATDANPTRRPAAEALGLEWFPSATELVRESGIDAVVVASNNRTHAALALQAIQAGKHVFIEKPIGVSVEEVESLLDAAAVRHLSVGVDHMMTKNAYNQLARDLLADKAIGSIEHLVLHMEFSFGMTASEAATWRCADPAELGGPIGDVGSHCLYMAEFLTGEPIVTIQCAYAPKHVGIAVEDGATIRFETRSGLSGVARVAFDQPRGTLTETIANLGFEAYGSAGMLEAKGTMFQLSGHHDEPARLSLATVCSHSRVQHVPDLIENIYARQIGEHAHSILAGIPLDGSDGLHNLRLVQAAHDSARNGGSAVAVEG